MKNPAEQAYIPAIQQYKRNLTKCDPVREGVTTWMCPECDRHNTTPTPLTIFYQCNCNWFGMHDDLILARRVGDY